MDNINYSGETRGILIDKNRDRTIVSRQAQVEITAPEDIQTVEHITQTGEDTGLTIGSRLIIISNGKAWKIAIGSDDQITPIAAPGEKRFYSSNETGDEIKAFIHLFNDGRIHVEAPNDISVVTLANLSANVTGDASAKIGGTLTADVTGNTELTTPNLTINGNVAINGNLSWSGIGSGAGGNPATMQGGISNTGGTIESNNVVLETHTHGGVQSGGDDTGGPN